jgi:hypothetical protein
MKKNLLYIICVLAVVVLTACSGLKRNNPYDPDGSAYKGVTYKGDINYPAGTSITAMIYGTTGLCLAGYSAASGYCVMRLEGTITDYVGSTGDTPGHFRYIQDICADDSGDIYAVDNKNIMQVITPTTDAMSSWTMTNVTTTVDKLSITYLSNHIYVSSNIDKQIFEYSTTGAFIDSVNLSFTAYGPFTPGRIFKSANHIYVVNDASKNQIVEFTPNLSQDGLYDMQDNIYDASVNGGLLELIASGAVYNVDENMVLSLKWGNFGVGPGMVFNGELIACDQTTGDTYLLDGQTIKRFGE